MSSLRLNTIFQLNENKLYMYSIPQIKNIGANRNSLKNARSLYKSTFSFTKKYDILLFTLINSLCEWLIPYLRYMFYCLVLILFLLDMRMCNLVPWATSGKDANILRFEYYTCFLLGLWKRINNAIWQMIKKVNFGNSAKCAKYMFCLPLF